jgi:hypothetical protein
MQPIEAAQIISSTPLSSSSSLRSLTHYWPSIEPAAAPRGQLALNWASNDLQTVDALPQQHTWLQRTRKLHRYLGARFLSALFGLLRSLFFSSLFFLCHFVLSLALCPAVVDVGQCPFYRSHCPHSSAVCLFPWAHGSAVFCLARSIPALRISLLFLLQYYPQGIMCGGERHEQHTHHDCNTQNASPKQSCARTTIWRTRSTFERLATALLAVLLQAAAAAAAAALPASAALVILASPAPVTASTAACSPTPQLPAWLASKDVGAVPLAPLGSTVLSLLLPTVLPLGCLLSSESLEQNADSCRRGERGRSTGASCRNCCSYSCYKYYYYFCWCF